MSAKRVLVIEGDPVQRVLLQTALSEAGYETDTALDETHAAELETLRNYDLVLARDPGRVGSLGTANASGSKTSAEIVTAVGERLGPPEYRESASIDCDRLQRLRADLSSELFTKLLQHFVDGGRERIACIAGLLDRGELTALAREAHDLKGASATFGAPRLRNRAALLEQAAKARDLAATRAALAELRSEAEMTWLVLAREVAASS